MSDSNKYYVTSNKFNPVSTLIFGGIGIALSILIGVIYAAITLINPIIYLNFLVLAGAFFVLALICKMVVNLSKSRNAFISFILCTVVCITAWYANWCYYFVDDYSSKSFFYALLQPGGVINYFLEYGNSHSMSIGRFTRSSSMYFDGGFLFLFHLIELAVFVIPVYMISKMEDYFCEYCDEYYNTREYFIADPKEFANHYQQPENGSLKFLEHVSLVSNLKHVIADRQSKPEITKIYFHFCDKCKKNSIVDISSSILKLDDKKRDELTKENKYIKGLYIDKETESKFRQIDPISTLTEKTTV